MENITKKSRYSSLFGVLRRLPDIPNVPNGMSNPSPIRRPHIIHHLGTPCQVGPDLVGAQNNRKKRRKNEQKRKMVFGRSRRSIGPPLVRRELVHPNSETTIQTRSSTFWGKIQAALPLVPSIYTLYCAILAVPAWLAWP